MMCRYAMQDDSTKDDDDDLFKQAMGDVEPLKPDNKTRFKPAAKKIRVRHHTPETDLPDVFSDALPETCPEKLNFSRSGVQPATLKKLRQGKLPIDKRIDLHGMNVDQARAYLLTVLAECETDGSRVILIVHGKGYSSPGTKPVIKPLLNRWLREVPSVLAFASAKPADGGTGAVYVLLKK